MEVKGIDVSSYQGDIDWAKVKASGIKFAILRITQKTGIDSCFEKNLTGCKANGIPVGVYKYSYALSASEIKAEAEGVVEALAGRGLDFPVWLDLEWNNQRESLTRDELSAMIKTFRAVIVAAGYKFGIYCNVDWYEHVIPEDCKSYDFWIARYPAADKGEITERLRPSYGVGWQYSSKGTVPGIYGSVDMDVFYKNYKEDTVMNLWDKTKALLDEQVDYLEKKSAASLDSKTANSGYNNYTKYSRDINSWGKMGCQGQPWCALYQFWINVKIFGMEKALDIMGNGFYNCNSVKAHAKANGTWHTTPKIGALVIFRNGAHIGRVIKVTSTMIFTNEGNTSAGATNNVEANGGCVAVKSYTIGNSQIDGYVWIDYETVPSIQKPEMEWKAFGTATSKVDHLFVRAEPNGEILGELMKGNRFEIDGTTAGMWSLVKVAGIGVAWVATKYIQIDGEIAQKPSEIADKQDKTERLFVGKVTASKLNVRTWAGTEFPQIKSYPQLGSGNLVDVMNYTQTAKDGSKWYYVRIAGKYYGFVHSVYIQRQ